MSADALAVNLDYYDGRSRLIDKKCRILSQIALRRMPKENYCEIRISSKKTMDMFIAQIIVIINESCTPTTVCAWIPSYKCRITISGAEPQIKQIKEFFDGTTSGAEASNNKENREINSTPDKQCSSGKRGFGIVAKDLFRSGLTPEGKVQTKAEKSPIAVPQRRPQNTFMGLLTTAVSQTAATKAHSTSSSSAPVAYELTSVQHQVVSACLAGRNVFYTGGAGTGKSTLLTVLIEKLAQVHGRQAVFVAATTGLAACAIGGTTVHQFAGISARLEDHGTSAELKAQHDRIVAQVSFIIDVH